MLDETVHQLRARVFLFFRSGCGVARQQHLRLDVNKHRGHVDEFGCDVDIQLAQFLNIGKILRRDLRNGNVVDVDVLLADEVEQQIQRAFVNARDCYGKREVVSLPFLANLSGRRHRSRRKIVDHFGVLRQLYFAPWVCVPAS